MKAPISLPHLGVLLCLFSPSACINSLLNISVQGDLLNRVVVANVLIVCLCLPVLLLALWALLSKGFGWGTVSEIERKNFLQRQQMPLAKRLIIMVAFMLFASGITAVLLYGLRLIWKPTTVPLLTYLSATLVSYFFASVTAFLWLSLCDHKLRATQTSTL